MNIEHDKTEVPHLHEFFNYPARFENSQKGGDLGKREKIKRTKIKDPARFENS